MSDEPKQRAQERLDEMVDDAIKTLSQSIKGTLVRERGSTRTADARWLLEVVLERQPAASQPGDGDTDGSSPVDDLANRREALKQALRNRRSEPSR